jgi:MSHA pilin protein MshA
MQSKGFTLIELVVVIVILGILAVTAAPKFINLQADAKTATLQGIQASMQSASALIYSKAIVKGNQNMPFATTNTVNIGDSVNNGELIIAYGYPIASQFERILPLQNNSSYSYVALGASIDPLLVYFNEDYSNGSAPTSITDACIVVYQIPQQPGQRASIKVNDCA